MISCGPLPPRGLTLSIGLLSDWEADSHRYTKNWVAPPLGRAVRNYPAGFVSVKEKTATESLIALARGRVL